ncbi:MAG: putative S-layer protein [Candidatus Pacearchaeota archaeon]
MNSRTFSLIAFSIFTLILLVGFGSALSLTATPSPVKLTDQNPSNDFTVSDDTNFNLTSTFTPQQIVSGSNTANIVLEATGDKTNVSSIDFNASLDGDVSSFRLGTYSASFDVVGVDSTNSSLNNSVTVKVDFEKQFFTGDNEGQLEIRDIEFDVLNGFGDDEDFWYPLDEVEVEFEVENNGNFDIEDIEIETCLYDVSAERCIMDEDDMDLSLNDFDLDEGDDQSIILTLKINPDDLRAGNDEYRLYVSAVGEIDDRDSGFDGDSTGTSDFRGIEIITDEEFIIIGNMQTPESVSCGQTVEITADVWNIGDDDLDDDEVFLRVFNGDLGLNEVIEFVSGIDAMDSERISFNLNVPNDAEEKLHRIEVTAYDDEDMGDNDIYENGEGDEADYSVFINVQDCATFEDLTAISASLDSEAVAGKQLSIKAAILNLDSKSNTYVLSASGHESWADSLNIDTSTFILGEGDSQESILTFDVSKDAEGTQEFVLEVTSGGKTISQPVSVNIEPRSRFPSITGFTIGGENTYLWGLGILNIILVLVIIFVAVRIARRNREPASEF